MALTVAAVGHALTHIKSVPTTAAALSGSMIVAAIAQETTTLSPDYYKDMNFTAMRTDHWSHSQGYDSTTPRNMMYAFTIILFICSAIQSPRFFARLYASLPTSKRQIQSDLPPPSAIPHSAIALTHSRAQTQRQVGGGGVFSGWFLRKGQLPTGLHSPTIEAKEVFSEKAFMPTTPYGDVITPSDGPESETPSLLPPPHVNPILNHLPFARWVHGAPFLSLPAPFGSLMHMPQLVVIGLYLAVCITALLWKTNPLPPTTARPFGDDFQRSGLVAMVQIPLVIALGVRGNIIGLCVGKGYERLKAFHKIVGRVCFLATGLHVAFWTAKWVWMGNFGTYSAKTTIIWGWVAWAGLVLIVFTSLPWVRKRWFTLFEFCHTIGIISFLIGTALHVKVAKPWCAAGAVIYMISIIFTLCKTKVAKAELLALQTASSTVVTIPALRTGWRAGQHVRIRVPALGWRLGFEGHPFTISSAPDGEGLILMCKNSGDWTRALHKLAQGSTRHSESALGSNAPVDVTMIVEGPHGGMGNTMLPAFSSVLLCAGGSGITHSLALAHDLMTKAATGVVRARTIDLVWVIRTEEAARPLMPTLLDMVNDAKAFEMACLSDRRYGGSSPLPTALRVKIFVTRCPSSSPLKLANTCAANSSADSIDISHITHEANSDPKNPFNDQNPFIDPEVQVAYLSRRPSSAKTTGGFSFSSPTSYSNSTQSMPLSSIAAFPKRVNFESVLSTLVEETIYRHGVERTNSSGVCVTACGPETMVESVNIAVRSIDPARRKAVGGVDFEEECFGY